MSELEQNQIEIKTQEIDLLDEPQIEKDEHLDDASLDLTGGESDEFEIVIDGEEPEKSDDEFSGQPAPEWVKDLRKKDRENQKRIKELETELSVHQVPKSVELGEKPTLDSAGYDTDEFEKQLEDWYTKKAQFDQQESAKRTEQEVAQKQWQERLTSYETKKTAIKSKVNDFEEAEEVARDALDKTQQGILIHGADNPEMLIYHLGKNPKKAKELAGVKDPILFAFKLAKIDAQLKVQQRKPQTSPERKLGGSGSLNGTTDSTLNKLRAEAAKTGDYTKVGAYKKQMRQKD